MDVFLVRHAIAHERSRSRWPNDALRPLTPAGERRFRKAARGLARCLPRSALLLTSPFVRARQTAAILAAALGRRAQPIECVELAPGKPVGAVFELLRKHRAPAVVLVGHEPNMGKLLGAALLERGRMRVAFKKGGAACVSFEGIPGPGRAMLGWLMPPRVLRSLG